MSPTRLLYCTSPILTSVLPCVCFIIQSIYIYFFLLAYECRIDLDEFCGCKIIPVSGYVCSNECAEKLAQELNKRNKEILELSVPVYYNEEYEEIRRKQIRRKQRVRGAVQRIRNFLVRSRSEVLVD